MSLIENVIRLRRRRCDERRRYLAELQHLGQRLRSDAARLQTEIAAVVPGREADAAGSLRERYAKIERSVVAIDSQIAAAGAALASAEHELQRYEFAFAQRHGAGSSAVEGATSRRRRARPSGGTLHDRGG